MLQDRGYSKTCLNQCRIFSTQKVSRALSHCSWPLNGLAWKHLPTHLLTFFPSTGVHIIHNTTPLHLIHFFCFLSSLQWVCHECSLMFDNDLGKTVTFGKRSAFRNGLKGSEIWISQSASSYEQSSLTWTQPFSAKFRNLLVETLLSVLFSLCLSH